MNHDFCRRLLAESRADLKTLNPSWLKGMWVMKTSTGVWNGELGGHYWHGQACCAWDAKRQMIDERIERITREVEA